MTLEAGQVSSSVIHPGVRQGGHAKAVQPGNLHPGSQPRMIPLPVLTMRQTHKAGRQCAEFRDSVRENCAKSLNHRAHFYRGRGNWR